MKLAHWLIAFALLEATSAHFESVRRLDGELGAPEFEYFHGGDDWDTDLCQVGSRQSPIDLPFFEEDIKSPIPRDFFSKVTSL